MIKYLIYYEATAINKNELEFVWEKEFDKFRLSVVWIIDSYIINKKYNFFLKIIVVFFF